MNVIPSFEAKKTIPLLVVLAATAILFFLPNQFENPIYRHHVRAKAVVTAVDNSALRVAGLITHGDQVCEIEVLSGKYASQRFSAHNMLLGKLEMDKIFNPGDSALVVLQPDSNGNTIIKAVMVEHYRMSLELFLLAAFGFLLIGLAGWLGFRAIVSFIFAILVFWKILIPMMLTGYDPIIVGLFATLLLTTVIILLVYGISRSFASAVLGSFGGIFITALMALYFVDAFKVHGAVLSFSEVLLYSGYSSLNLTKIFIATIFIASSGAIMDVAVDITSAVKEVVVKKPDISRLEAVRSGLTVGRAVIGTMTTTLLLAYSSACMILMMAFVAQGVPMENILNYNYVAAEILHTMLGSFGLITVVPLTAVASGILLVGVRGEKMDKKHYKELKGNGSPFV